jgi:hypothetical protein
MLTVIYANKQCTQSFIVLNVIILIVILLIVVTPSITRFSVTILEMRH